MPAEVAAARAATARRESGAGGGLPTPDGARVLVTEGEQRASLAVVRSLGQAGLEVHVCSAGGRSLAGASGSVRAEHRVADAERDPAGHAEGVGAVLRRTGAGVLVPMTEASLLALLPRREALGDVVLPFPDAATFRRVCDKAAVLDAARELGMDVPEQVRVESSAELGALDPRELAYPLVVKPARSVVEGPEGRRKLGVRHAADAAALEAAVADLPPDAFPLLLQRRIEGQGIGVFLLLWDGELLARFAHRRLREKPPSGGVSVLRESIAADPGLVERSRALLERLGWKGVAMVEYKRERSTGRHYVMEVNGRFWGSLQLAIDAGVDFPRLLVEAAAGREPESVSEYRTGVRTRWLMGDVDHLLARLRHSREELDLGPEAPGRLAAVAGFLAAFGPGSRNEVFRWRDPRPAGREVAGWLAALGGRGGAPRGEDGEDEWERGVTS